MKKSTRAWVRKAEADHQAAELAARGSAPLHDQVCFHCQQSAEKYLKALMEELGLSIPRIHDLDELRRLLLPHHPALRSLRRGAAFLTNFAVAARYPGFDTQRRTAISALRWASRVRETCRGILGIPPPRHRKAP